MASQARDGFQFRFALTEGSATDQDRSGSTVDPRIYSTGVSYQRNLANGGHAWFAVAYDEKHEDLSITDLNNCRRLQVVMSPMTMPSELLVVIPTIGVTA